MVRNVFMNHGEPVWFVQVSGIGPFCVLGFGHGAGRVLTPSRGSIKLRAPFRATILPLEEETIEQQENDCQSSYEIN